MVTVTDGMARSSSRSTVKGRSTRPEIVRVHSPGPKVGTSPTCSTGKRSVRYCPGGRRAGSIPLAISSLRFRSKKPMTGQSARTGRPLHPRPFRARVADAWRRFRANDYRDRFYGALLGPPRQGGPAGSMGWPGSAAAPHQGRTRASRGAGGLAGQPAGAAHPVQPVHPLHPDGRAARREAGPEGRDHRGPLRGDRVRARRSSCSRPSPTTACCAATATSSPT